MKIKEFWRDVLAQNAEKLPDYFHKDAAIRWHCSNEQFTVSEYVRVNCEYPGKWQGEIERVEEMDEDWAEDWSEESARLKASCWS